MRKNQVIDQILDNHVYLPESGMCKDLRKALLKFSFSQLTALNLIITLKYTQDVEDTGNDET